MTRAWAPRVNAIRSALAAAILAERDAQLADLPEGLRGDRFEVQAAVHRGARPLLPSFVRIYPPAGSTFAPEVTRGMEADLAFPLRVHVQALAEEDAVDLLTEAVGLIADALAADPTLGGVCGGTGDPAIALGAIDTDSAQAEQEVVVRLVARE